MDEQFERAMEEVWDKYYNAGQNEKMPPDTLGIFNECFTYGCNAAYTERQKEIDELKGKLEVAKEALENALEQHEFDYDIVGEIADYCNIEGDLEKHIVGRCDESQDLNLDSQKKIRKALAQLTEKESE